MGGNIMVRFIFNLMNLIVFIALVVIAIDRFLIGKYITAVLLWLAIYYIFVRR